MEVARHQNDERLKRQYFDLVEEKYGSSESFGYFLKDLKEASRFSFERQQPNFLAVLDGERMLAHAALIQDSQAPKGKAFWGFFESNNDKEVFSLLWRELNKLAREKGFDELLGPVNGSVWHQYRFMKETDASPFFKTELFCEPFYYDLMKGVPHREISYYSAYRTEFRNLIAITEPFYKRMLAGGFSIAESAEATEERLGAVLSISKKVFRDSWGYTDLAMADFTRLYSTPKLASHLSRVYYIQKGQETVGYGSVFLEKGGSLILKTAAILPEFQNLGLANALLHKIHSDARANRCGKVIYALIRESNAVGRLPKDDAVIFRRYAAFESKT